MNWFRSRAATNPRPVTSGPCLALLLLLAGPVLSQSTSALPVLSSKTAGACHAPQNAELDFWIGDWELRLPSGEFAGTVQVERRLGGCGLAETMMSPDSSYRGESYTAFRRGTGTWLQLWSDTDGDVYQLEGTVVGGRLVYHGFQMDSSGSRSLIRITYTPSGGTKGEIRQVGQISPDDGRTWQAWFEARYIRRDHR
jgi:hypothetical protein